MLSKEGVEVWKRRGHLHLVWMRCDLALCFRMAPLVPGKIDSYLGVIDHEQAVTLMAFGWVRLFINLWDTNQQDIFLFQIVISDSMYCPLPGTYLGCLPTTGSR